MYSATKTFENFNEAVEAIMSASGSLAQSDLHIFKAENFDELIKVVREYEDNNEGYNWADVWMGNEGYVGSFMRDLGLESPNLGEQECGIELFNYTTASGTNRVTIRELKSEDGTIKGYEAVYRVESSKPIEYSSAMQSFKNAGWNCSEKTYTDRDGIGFLSKEEAKQKREEYEQSLIEEMREKKKIPDVFFDVGIYRNSVSSWVIGDNAFTIEILLQNHPEISDEVVEIIDEQIARINSVTMPTDSQLRRHSVDSEFFAKNRNKVISTLMRVKGEILKKKLASKETELSAMEAESREYDAAEAVIGKLEQRQGKEIGE